MYTVTPTGPYKVSHCCQEYSLSKALIVTLGVIADKGTLGALGVWALSAKAPTSRYAFRIQKTGLAFKVA